LHKSDILQQLESGLSEREKREDNYTKYLRTVSMQNRFIQENFCYKKLSIYILILLKAHGSWQVIGVNMNIVVLRFMNLIKS